VAPDTSIGAVIPVVLSAAMTVVLAGTLRGAWRVQARHAAHAHIKVAIIIIVAQAAFPCTISGRPAWMAVNVPALF
jgi:hypothetical protein